jgi:hypothetical protein
MAERDRHLCRGHRLGGTDGRSRTDEPSTSAERRACRVAVPCASEDARYAHAGADPVGAAGARPARVSSASDGERFTTSGATGAQRARAAPAASIDRAYSCRPPFSAASSEELHVAASPGCASSVE